MSVPIRPPAPRTARSLWPWSLAVLEVADARRTLLQMQDGHGLNGSLILWAAWCDRACHDVDDADAERLIAGIHAMDRYVVRRLREVRRHAASPRPGFDEEGLRALRREVYQAELAAERLIQDRLEARTLAVCGRSGPDAGVGQRLLRACVRALETPVLLADDQDAAGPEGLFATLLAQAPPLPPADPSVPAQPVSAQETTNEAT